MRIVIAPDKFAGTLSAVEAAEALAQGWHETDPDADIERVPLSDGGPGFVEVLHTALGGKRVSVTVTGPQGNPVDAEYLLVSDTATAYIESAQACGLHLVPATQRNPEHATSYGVGELISHAVSEGAETAVVGLGGSATNDGGAGMLAALGAAPSDLLAHGGSPLAALTGPVNLAPARAATAGVRLVAATDVDNPLVGDSGASAVFGPQKGADEEQVRRLETALSTFADAVTVGGEFRNTPGAGAAGGLGYALLLLDGSVESGVQRVLEAVGLAERVASADLVLTGEGSFDSQSLRGKLPHGVATTAAKRGTACAVVAGVVDVAPHEARAAGITSTYSLVESAGSVEAALEQPAAELRTLAATVARRHSTA
ncbi:glycerate kinase [Haloactinospora alba]|uniref:Glycerate kinase n=1 Tax=Haloactinospora alba TaxID=405555 RepID=A0A543NJP4_9ACTN|nr:glycerate kinase [Haloactinospora alba]TQN32039.1 glycerate kinase [Haloactinospora alba]